MLGYVIFRPIPKDKLDIFVKWDIIKEKDCNDFRFIDYLIVSYSITNTKSINLIEGLISASSLLFLGDL